MTGLRPETLLAQAAGADDPTTGGIIPPLQPSTTFLRDPDNVVPPRLRLRPRPQPDLRAD